MDKERKRRKAQFIIFAAGLVGFVLFPSPHQAIAIVSCFLVFLGRLPRLWFVGVLGLLGLFGSYIGAFVASSRSNPDFASVELSAPVFLLLFTFIGLGIITASRFDQLADRQIERLLLGADSRSVIQEKLKEMAVYNEDARRALTYQRASKTVFSCMVVAILGTLVIEKVWGSG